MATAPRDRAPTPAGPGAMLTLPIALFGQSAVIIADCAREDIRVEVDGAVVIKGQLPAHLAIRMRDCAIDCLRAVGETNAQLAMRRFVVELRRQEAVQHAIHVVGDRVPLPEARVMHDDLAMADPDARDGQRRDPLHPTEGKT